jgi:uncharacterized protein
MDTQQSFLGTGWTFPPEFDRESRTVQMVRDKDDVDQSLHILLSTSLGERVMQPLYGCNLRDYQFEPINNTFLGFLTDLVKRALLFFEPRIVVERIEITEPGDFQIFEGKLQISIDYVIASTNKRNNFVYPFYPREADKRI